MDREELAASAWFHKIPSIGSRTLFALTECFGSLREAYEASEKALREVLTGRQFGAFRSAKYAMNPEDYLEQVEEKGIRYVSYFDDIYPEKLKYIPDVPFGIFVKGNLPAETVPTVAVIGARACSEYGKRVAEQFAGELAVRGIQIISGMARGIDSISQSACIQAGGQTFAVLGSGVDVCYPEELYPLYESIAKSGGILSPYAPGMQPLSQNFPPRNRIISGLSDVVLVVESRKKSGTLITVDMALEQGKEVAVIPGRITDALSQGCHELLKQGATPVFEIEQLLSLLKELPADFDTKDTGVGYKTEPSWIYMNSREVTPFLNSILQVLEQEALDAETIYEKWLKKGHTGNFQELLSGLMDLELMDLCKSHKNRFSIR